MSSIVFYCKTCGGMFFAASTDRIDAGLSRDVAKYLSRGHRLKSDVPKEQVRYEFWEATCADCGAK